MDIIKEEFRSFIWGMLILSLFTYAAFSIFGLYNLNVFFSISIGCIYTILNFFFMAKATSLAMSKPQVQAVSHTVINYFIRMILTAEIIYLSIKIPYINAIAVVLPMFYPKILVIFWALIRRKNR